MSAFNKAKKMESRTGMIPTMHEQSPRHPAWYLIHRLSHQQVSLRSTYMSRARLVVTCPYCEIGHRPTLAEREPVRVGPRATINGRRPGATPGQCTKVFSTFPDGRASQTWKLEGINFICSLAFGSAQIYSLYLSGKATNIVRVLVVFGGAIVRITSGTSVTFPFCRCTMQWQLQPAISWRLTFNFYRSHWR